MKKEEQTVHPDTKATKRQKRSAAKFNTNEAEERAAEMPGKEASVAAEMKNRRK
jgi:hypothetical protein